MAGVQDIAALLMPPAAEPPMGALAMIQQARQQLATQPSRVAPQDTKEADADTAAMMPETYVNPAVEHVLGSLASLPKRAIEGAAAYTPGSGEIPEGLVGASLESAMLPMGTGAIAGVPMRAGETVLGAGPIRSAAIRHEGKTYEGTLHSDAYQSAADATGKEFGQVIGKTNPRDVGFVTSDGRFVSRDDAAKLVGYDGKSELAAEMFNDGELNAPSAVQKVIRAYHGSPHDFDKFSLDKIGTGEGAQAYGHGLYFAENEGVAKGYRDALAGKSMRLPDGTQVSPQTAVDAIKQNVSDAHPEFGQPTQVSQWVFNRIHAGKDASTIENDIKGMAWEPNQKDAARTALKATAGWKTDPKMYEVNINADPEHFLDWDKPLSEQPGVASKLGFSPRTSDEINAEAEALFNKHGQYPNMPPDAKTRLAELQTELDKRAPDVTGADYYRQTDPDNFLHSQLATGNSMPGRSSTLQQAGIPGIKYLDQGSRAAGDGSRNYVVFDDKLIDIARKYGMGTLAALPPAALAALSQQQDPQQ